ncbi:cell adhesion molecule CEACAM6-like isoform X2 [Gasterosteus aculeatus]
MCCVTVIQSQDGWRVNYLKTDVCAVKGSTVYIICFFTHPPGIDPSDIKDRFWFTKEKDGEPVDLRTDSEYSGRVTYGYYSDWKRCYLLITDVRESDSAEYKFTFMTNKPGEKYTGSPGVTLSVTGLQVQVRRSDSTWLELTCHSSCVLSDRAEYYWYKNEEIIKRGSSLLVSSGSTDRYSCYLEGSSGHLSPAVYGPQRLSVSASPSAEMLEGDSVTLTCSADANPAANYTWYKEHEDSPRASGQIFTITDFTAEHSGNYYCEAQNEMGRSNSTLLLITSSGVDRTTMIIHITRWTLVVVMLILLLLFCLWTRKKKAVSSTTEPHESREAVEMDLHPECEDLSDMAAQREDPEEQEDRV